MATRYLIGEVERSAARKVLASWARDAGAAELRQ